MSRPGAASPPQSAGTCKSGRFGRGGTQASSRCGGAGIPGQSRACLASSGPGGPAWLWQVSEGGSGPRWTRGSPAPAVRLLAPPESRPGPAQRRSPQVASVSTAPASVWLHLETPARNAGVLSLCTGPEFGAMRFWFPSYLLFGGSGSPTARGAVSIRPGVCLKLRESSATLGCLHPLGTPKVTAWSAQVAALFQGAGLGDRRAWLERFDVKALEGKGSF